MAPGSFKTHITMTFTYLLGQGDAPHTGVSREQQNHTVQRPIYPVFFHEEHGANWDTYHSVGSRGDSVSQFSVSTVVSKYLRSSPFMMCATHSPQVTNTVRFKVVKV